MSAAIIRDLCGTGEAHIDMGGCVYMTMHTSSYLRAGAAGGCVRAACRVLVSTPRWWRAQAQLADACARQALLQRLLAAEVLT